MIILGIETSCDETAAAILEVNDGSLNLKSNVIATQIDIHKQYGGVVPEIAARSHIEAIIPVLDQALTEAKVSLKEIDAIGVTHGPGLSGALLIGTQTAQSLAWANQIPLFPINHVLAHVYANFIDPQKGKWTAPKFPMLALVVSGGHTQIMLFKDHFDYELLGQTMDDAVGEAFDKVAKIIGLPYPGGPSVEQAALKGDSDKYRLPRPKVENPYGFSYSGLKTAVLRRVQDLCGKSYDFPSYQLAELLEQQQVNDISASFQKSALGMLVDRLLLAFNEHSPASVVIAGGVAASQALRDEISQRIPINVDYAAKNLCTDNAAMIGALTYFQSKQSKAISAFSLEVNSSLKM